MVVSIDEVKDSYTGRKTYRVTIKLKTSGEVWS
jgi:hypothetical protein